ncbi:hypothetical protein AFI02nite_12700 [Aliivibrio fischeri]|uniref:Uncharacterized protein n=1 Tax=Aliivibrio fischeri TaxID=668 RepID=A0A510UF34_ALIFS|nr:hypothetical protein AFI02nite_12700 [Aliivibrio fischeri]
MGVYKSRGHDCPMCKGSNTSIRTSKKITSSYQVLYCDCNNEDCLTRFTVDLTTGHVIHTIYNINQHTQPQEQAKDKELQLTLNI